MECSCTSDQAYTSTAQRRKAPVQAHGGRRACTAPGAAVDKEPGGRCRVVLASTLGCAMREIVSLRAGNL